MEAIAFELEQEVIHNNKDIFARIVSELNGAESDIMVASAWFTDPELFELILRKVEEQVNVQIIIADNQENLKLDFDLLVSKGASVTKIKNVGYGIMHQKFCVIDKKIALHGSYNWSMNARKNNHESIIVTNHKETVDSLIANFNDIKQKAFHLSGDEVIEEELAHLPAEVKIEKHTAKTHAINEFTKVLDSMIAAEIGNFDRSMLRAQGYDRSQFNNGDHQVLTKALDTVYSVFINDIDVVEDKKRRLITKIDEQEKKSINAFEESLNLQMHTAQIDSDNTALNTKNTLATLKSDIDKNRQDVEDIRINKITVHQKLIDGLNDKIRFARREFIQPKFKWFEFIPVAIANVLLFCYLILFYSSAAYILLFSVADAKLAAETAGVQIAPEIFNPDALKLAMQKTGSGVIFIILFVCLPISCALIKLFSKNKYVIYGMAFVGIVLIDSAIAYKVSSAIYDMKLLSGDTLNPWAFKMAFTDPNFYLVFLLGGFGLLMFKFAFEKLTSIFEERNPDIATLKNDLVIKHLEEDIRSEDVRISELKNEIQRLEINKIDLISQQTKTQSLLDTLPSKFAYLQELIKIDLITGKQHIQDISSIYKSHVENDHLPISVDSLNDRINVFLEGWNDYLHKEYAVAKATEKSRQAFDTAVLWQADKLNMNQIDKRIKI